MKVTTSLLVLVAAAGLASAKPITTADTEVNPPTDIDTTFLTTTPAPASSASATPTTTAVINPLDVLSNSSTAAAINTLPTSSTNLQSSSDLRNSKKMPNWLCRVLNALLLLDCR